jgi:ribonuclease P protein component
MGEHEQPAQAGSHRFGPDKRLRRRSEFQRVFETGFRVHGRFLTLVAAPNDTGAARLGIVASRKLGNAVQRNRAKRLIRDIFRQVNTARPGLDVVVIPRRELFDAAYASLENDFRSVFTRCASRLQRGARA